MSTKIIDISNTKLLLQNASNEDLEPLVEYIINTSTESLSENIEYKQYKPNHGLYADLIFDEIRLFGGNTFANLWRRGKGPTYLEVVQDVASKFKVKNISSLELNDLEEALITAILREAYDKSEGKDRRAIEEVLNEAGLDNSKITSLLNGSPLAGLVVPVVAQVILYRSSVIIAHSISQQILGHGIRSVATGGAAMLGGRALAALAGPLGWIIAGIWSAIDIAGPAYRVTIPCVLHIAMLRLKVKTSAQSEFIKGAFDE